MMKKKLSEDKPLEVEVLPLKDHTIHQNKVHIEFKKGERQMVPKMFIPNLKTEGVIPGGKR
jgi:hypothetical protein